MFLVPLFIMPNSNVMPGRIKRIPRDVKPAVSCQELVGVFTGAEAVDKPLELARVLGTDVGSLAELVLGVTDTTNESVDTRVAEAGVDDNGPDLAAGGFQ